MSNRLEVQSEIYKENTFQKGQIINNGNSVVTLDFIPIYENDVEHDEDGDLIVCRKQKIILEFCESSTIELVGLQIWRGAFLLSDFILSNPQIFKNQTILELASGVGFTSIIAGIFAKEVIATDVNQTKVLDLINKNIENNKHIINAKMLVKALNFYQLEWSIEMLRILQNTSIIIAADVVYDDELTEAFVQCLTKILMEPPQKTFFLALEKRYVFTIADLDSVPPCFDHFIKYIQNMWKSPPMSDWKIEYVETKFKQSFEYDRTEQLLIFFLSMKENDDDILRYYRKVEFDCAIPGCVYTKKIKVKSRYKLPVVGPTQCHPLDNVFVTNKLAKTDENKYIVNFNPISPWHLSTSYQYFYGIEEGAQEVICLQGDTLGPTITLKPKKLIFFTNNDLPSKKYSIQLSNISKCTDYFMWDYDQKQSEINFEPKLGQIQHSQSVKIVVNFTPRRYGLYFRRFYCLFSLHEPLMIEIWCLHHKTEIKIDLRQYITYPQPFPKYPTMYCRYINDVAKDIYPQSKSLLILSKRYIDFGSVWLEGDEFVKKMEVSLTSFLNTEIQIIWDIDQSEIFTIIPQETCIKRSGNYTFIVEFKPEHPEMLYSTELHACVLWGSGLEFMTPVPLTLSIIGNSFPPNSCSWEPFVHLDKKKIIVPATVPSVPSYTTFTITRSNDLPIQFKLFPSDNHIISRFMVKPQEGLMLDDSQIILVQLFPGEKTDEPNIEHWTLLLNLVHKINLEFCGTVEKPFLKIAKNKNIVFPITHLNVEYTRTVVIQNPTCLHLKYQCRENSSPSIFRYNKKDHKIGPGEEHLFDFIFHPTELGEFRTTVTVDIEWWDRTPKIGNILDPRRDVKTETVLYLVGRSEKSDITCHPDYLLIDDVPKSAWGEERFKLINNGNSAACVLLECLPRAIGSQAGPVTFVPNQIVLPPHDSTVVTIHCKGEYVGLQTLKIVYTVYTSKEFNVQSTGEQIFLLALDFCCTFPILQIVDIRYKSMCKWLSKFSVWSMLMINKLNEQLKNTFVRKDQKSYMKFPEDSDESPFFIVQMLIKNISPVPVQLEVGYIKTCECNDDRTAQRRGSKFSYRTCNHPQEFSATPYSKFIKPCGETMIELKAKYNYNVQNYFRVLWTIKSADLESPELISTFTFYIQRRILAPGQASLDLFLPGPQREFYINLEPVYIGDSNHYVQIVWMYNNSQKDVEYNCKWEEGDNSVFKIFNPNAMVRAIERHPLLIMFRPYEMVTYKATLLITTSESDIFFKLMIKGKGEVKEDSWSCRLSKRMPKTSLFPEDTPDLLQADLSVSHICLDPISTHSLTKKVFFLKNNTMDHMEYDWRRTLVWGIVHISVFPQHGILAPGQLIAFHLLARSLRFPCKANIAIECVMRNLKNTYNYHEKKKYLSKLARTYDACFTICNEGELNYATHYHSPGIGLKTGPSPLNTFLCLGISLFIYGGELEERMIPSLISQHKLFPHRKLDTFDQLENFELTEHESNIIVKVLIRAVSDVFKQKHFLASIESNPRIVRYYELDSYSNEKVQPELQNINMSGVITNILYNNFMSLFSLDCEPALYDVNKRKIDRAKRLSLNNKYYRDLIVQEINQMVTQKLATPSTTVHMAAIREYSGFLGVKDVDPGDYFAPF